MDALRFAVQAEVKGTLEANVHQVIIPFAMIAGLLWLVCKSIVPNLANCT